MKMKRLIAVLLAVVLALGLIPLTSIGGGVAYAEESEGESATVTWPQLTSFSMTNEIEYLYDSSKVANATVACKIKEIEIEHFDELQTIEPYQYAGKLKFTVEAPVKVVDGMPTSEPASNPSRLWINKDNYSATVDKSATLDKKNLRFDQDSKDADSYGNTSYNTIIKLVLDSSTYYYGVYATVEQESSAENNVPTIKAGVTNPATAEATVGTAWTLDLTSIFEDADGDSLTYKVKANDAEAVSTNASYSYTPAATGNTTLVFTANDGKADSEAYTVNLTAKAPAEDSEGEATTVTWPQLTSFSMTNEIEYLYDASTVAKATVACKIKEIEIEHFDELQTINPYQYAGKLKFTVEAPVKVVDGMPTSEPASNPSRLWINKDNYSATVDKSATLDKKNLRFDQDSKDADSYGNTSYNTIIKLVLDSSTYYYGVYATVEQESSAENNVPTIKAGVTNPATAEATVGTAWTLDLTSIFEDADGDSLTYKVKVNDAEAVSTNASYSYTPAATGNTTLVFTANDGKADSEAYTVNLTAKAPCYKITTSTDFYKVNSYTSPMGTVKISVDDTSVSEAAEGTTVVAKATPQKCDLGSGRVYYDAKFDHWEVTGVTGIADTALKEAELTFTMPAAAVSLKAVFVKAGSPVTLTANTFDAGDVTLRLNDSQFASTYDSDSGTHMYDSITDTMISGATISASIVTAGTANTNYKLKEWQITNTTTNQPVEVTYKEWGTALGTIKCPYFTVDGTSSYTIKAIFEAKDYANVNVTVNDATMGTATAQVGTAEASSSLIAVTEGTTVQLHATPTTGFVFESWKVTYGDGVGVTIADSDKVDASFVMPATGKKVVNVVATFKKDPNNLSKACALTDAVLLDGDGNQLGYSDRSSTNYTITVPADTDTSKLGEMTLKLTASDYATIKKSGDTENWPAEGKACGMTLDTPATFVVTAEDGTTTKTYTITIKQEAAPNAPTLSAGSATRTGKTGATVTFTSSEAGTYFYKVVEHGAAAPTVDTSKNGTAAVKGENAITLSNLTEDARDIYIVVKNANGVVSDSLKVEIPAYSSGSTGGETTDEGAYTITYSGPKGGKLVPSRTKADKGDTITVTISPDSGYQMVAGSMTYTLAVSGGTTTKITGNQFTMPEGDVTLSCQWETASVTTSGITAFSINGVSAAVNNTTNVITITLPRGTDVTKLTPVISTSGVKSLSPAGGKTVDFTNSVTYTATMDDGTVKTYTVTVYVDKGSLADQFWDKLTDFYNQTPWWEYAKTQQSASKYPKYW